MKKTILITGSTDGIGLETAKLLASQGHRVLVHGRNPTKLKQVEEELGSGPGEVEAFAADLSDLSAVDELARAVVDKHPKLDVLINNAGVFATPNATTKEGLDVRFAVNTIAPYLLTRKLLSCFDPSGRVVNLSSAAQSPVDLTALKGKGRLTDGPAYAQSKLALTMWSRHMALSLGDGGPAIIAVNPGSMLGTKMVATAYGVAGADIGIGADILRRAALSDEFEKASGQYFDNDSGRFASPHPDALDEHKVSEVMRVIENILAPHLTSTNPT